MRAQTVRSLVSSCLVAASAVAQSAVAGEHKPNGGESVKRAAADAILPLSTETIAEVPFELYQHHLIVTRGSIGRLDGLSLLIDTGSIPSMVDGRIARKLNLQAEPSTLVAFGQTVAIQSTVLEDGIRMGSMRSGPVPAGVGDLSYLEGVRIDAIVGLDVLARTSFSIDYRTRVLRFAPTGREDWVAPLEVAWPFLTVRMTIGGQQVRLLVDTGSTDLVLFKARLPATLSSARWRGDKTVRYASGVARLQRLELRQVRLGEHVWDKLEGWTLDREPQYPSDIDGVLGVLSLGCTRVRFDFERNELGCSGSLTMGSLATPAAAGDRRDRASRQALAFFERVGAGRAATFLEALRPLPLAALLRAQVMVSLPLEGEVHPSEKEAHKLALGSTRNALGADPQSAFTRPLGAFDAAAVERAKAGAARWLQNSECLKVLTEFTDGEGRTLDLTLATWGMSAAEYALSLPFQDGAAIPRCRRAHIELVTHVGLRQVYVCPVGVGALNSRFAQTQVQTPALAEAMVIHEMLHTLGLGENPPSSFEITERVRTRCR